MSRKLIILTAVMAVALSGAAFAAVQNIKVSGDIAMQGVARNLSMEAKKTSDGGSSMENLMDAQEYFTSQVRLRFDADLTENVSGTVRLINERLWGAESNSDTDIDLDLAYIHMKEFLYQPLTITVGRQNLRYGNAFIVGDPDTNQTSSEATPSEQVTQGGTTYNNRVMGDMSLRKSFDAARAVFDFSPFTVDLVAAKPVEGDSFKYDDVNMFGMNAAYQWGSLDGITEGYFWAVTNPHNIARSANGDDLFQPKENQSVVYTLGGRMQFNPIEKLTLGGEAGYQFGDVVLPAGGSLGDLDATGINEYRHLSAGAAQVYGEYRFMTKYNPKMGFIYTFKSGDDDANSGNSSSHYAGESTYNEWQTLFEDQTQGEIINVLFANTNCHVITVSGSLMPREDITVGLNYTWLAQAQKDTEAQDSGAYGWFKPVSGPARSNLYSVKLDEDYVASEVDAYATYDYTEDVQLKLTGAWFIPGDYFNENNDGVAYSARAGINLNF
ncbi:MAG: alginate export family protein [Candidatus Omnitrophota bacterium]